MPFYMTSAEHIDILLQGAEAWNRSRREHAADEAPDLSGSQFAHANLNDFDLHGVVMQKAYLREAALRGACLCEADLQSAYLMGADLERAQLSRSRLVAVNLNGANLTACAFDGADMREADCGGAELSGADFTGADMHGVNLLGANLEGARFVRTKGLSSRQLMAARNWEKASFDPDLAGCLELPFLRLGGELAPNAGPAATTSPDPMSLDPGCLGQEGLGAAPLDPVSMHGNGAQAREVHKTMAVGRNSSRASVRGAGYSTHSRRSRAGTLDPAGR